MHRNKFHKNKIRVYFCCGHRGIHSHSLIYSQLINGHIGPIWNPKPGAISEKLHEHQSHVFINVCVWEEKYSFYAFNNQLKKDFFLNYTLLKYCLRLSRLCFLLLTPSSFNIFTISLEMDLFYKFKHAILQILKKSFLNLHEIIDFSESKKITLIIMFRMNITW